MPKQKIYVCEVQNEYGKWRRTNHMATSKKKLRAMLDKLGDTWTDEYYYGDQVPNGRKICRFEPYIPARQFNEWLAHSPGPHIYRRLQKHLSRKYGLRDRGIDVL